MNAIHVNIMSLSKNFDNLCGIWCTGSTIKNNANLHLPNFDIISQGRRTTGHWCADLHPQNLDL